MGVAGGWGCSEMLQKWDKEGGAGRRGWSVGVGMLVRGWVILRSYV